MAERPGELEKRVVIDDEKTDVEVVAVTTESNPLTDRPREINPVVVVESDAVDSDDPDKIREGIEETRAEMSETIDAIQEKLSFSNISEQVKTEVSDYVGETIQTAKDTVYDTVMEKGEFIMNYADKRIKEIADTEVVKTVGRNPWALALIGLGVGMLFFGSSKKKRSKFRYDESYDDGRDYSRGFSSKNQKSTLEAAQNKISGAASVVGSSVSNAADAVSDTVGSAANAVSGTVSNAAGSISETAGDVADKAYKQVGNLGAKAQDFAGTAQDSYEYYMEENPLAVGAAALALGAAVGLAIPSTRVENKYMGEARNNLLQKAEETARGAVGDAVGKVQQVAGQVKETVQEEVKNVQEEVKK